VALNNLAWHLMEENPRLALNYAERARSLVPQSAEILDTLAMVHLHNEQPELAMRMNRRAVEQGGDRPVFAYHQALILEAAGRIADAENVLATVLRDDVDFPERSEAERMLERLKGR